MYKFCLSKLLITRLLRQVWKTEMNTKIYTLKTSSSLFKKIRMNKMDGSIKVSPQLAVSLMKHCRSCFCCYFSKEPLSAPPPLILGEKYLHICTQLFLPSAAFLCLMGKSMHNNRPNEASTKPRAEQEVARRCRNAVEKLLNL